MRANHQPVGGERSGERQSRSSVSGGPLGQHQEEGDHSRAHSAQKGGVKKNLSSHHRPRHQEEEELVKGRSLGTSSSRKYGEVLLFF